jgi:hypothetical protein
MNYCKRYISEFLKALCFLLLIVSFSCQEEANIPLKNPDYNFIVVEGRITDEMKRHTIRLTQSAPYFYNDTTPAITNAEVYIIEEGSGTRIDLTLDNQKMGYYMTDPVSGSIGETYTLNIEYNYETYTASSYLDSVLVLDSMKYEYEFVAYAEQGFYKIKVSGFEPPPMGDYYMFKLYVNDSLFNDELIRTAYTDDQLFDNTYLNDIDVFWLPQEEIITDTNHVVLEMLSISKEEFYFIEAFIPETYYNGSIFDGPPANIPTNIACTECDIDGLGFFGASSVFSIDMMLYKEHDESTNDPDYKR